MCNQYRSLPAEVLTRYFGVEAPADGYKLGLGPRGRGPYVRPSLGGGTRSPIAVVGLWSLLADGAKTPEPRGMTNNARAKGLDRLKTFQGPWRRGQRCLVPAASYAEPNYERFDELQKSVWWDLARADGEPLALAGIYNEPAAADGVVMPSYTLVTINCNDHLLLNRMHRPETDRDGRVLPMNQQDKRSVVPVLPEHWAEWLHGSVETATRLLRLPPPEWYAARPRQSERLATR
jgi:putative SOS response-associated peptidase YedK